MPEGSKLKTPGQVSVLGNGLSKDQRCARSRGSPCSPCGITRNSEGLEGRKQADWQQRDFSASSNLWKIAGVPGQDPGQFHHDAKGCFLWTED